MIGNEKFLRKKVEGNESLKLLNHNGWSRLMRSSGGGQSGEYCKSTANKSETESGKNGNTVLWIFFL